MGITTLPEAMQAGQAGSHETGICKVLAFGEKDKRVVFIPFPP